MLGHMTRVCTVSSRNVQTFSQHGCTTLHSHQLRLQAPGVPFPRQHLILAIFYLSAIGVGGSDITLWLHICISLVIHTVEQP